MQAVQTKDWLRVHRDLLEAEKAFSEKLRLYADGLISREELDAARGVVDDHRLLASAVDERVAQQ